MKSIYVAAPFREREAAKAAANTLKKLGLRVTSTWIDKHLDTPPHSPEQLAQEARTDLYDVDRADALVLLNNPELEQSMSGGRHLEMGFALARGKEVFLLGPRTSVFHYLPAVNHIESLEEIKEWI